LTFAQRLLAVCALKHYRELLLNRKDSLRKGVPLKDGEIVIADLDKDIDELCAIIALIREENWTCLK